MLKRNQLPGLTDDHGPQRRHGRIGIGRDHHRRTEPARGRRQRQGRLGKTLRILPQKQEVHHVDREVRHLEGQQEVHGKVLEKSKVPWRGHCSTQTLISLRQDQGMHREVLLGERRTVQESPHSCQEAQQEGED